MTNGRLARRMLAFLGLVVSLDSPASAAAQVTDVNQAFVRTAEQFVRRLESGSFDSAAAMLSPAVPATALGADQLRQIWSQLSSASGKLVELSLFRVVPQDTMRLVELAARFERQSMTIRVVLMPDQTVGGLWFLPAANTLGPPPYADTTRFAEHSLRLGDEPWMLDGTLSLPSTDSLVPAVVLIQGSGPHDRDETIGPNKPFRDLAWGLASRGIAVLRYDKRTWTYAGRLPPDITVRTEVTDDALAAVRFLQSHPRINANRVFVAGHSLGGMMAPDIATRDSSVAGIIILASPARPLLNVVRDQVAYIASLGETDDRTRATLNAVLDSLNLLERKTLPPETQVMGAPASYYYDLESYEPARTARKLDLPIFVLHALRDYQVTEDDLDGWIHALQGRRRATVNEYPALNHVFMEGRGRATPAEYANPGHVAEIVIRDIASWIQLRSTT